MADAEALDPITAAAWETARRHRLAGLLPHPAALKIWSNLPEVRSWLNRARDAASEAGPQGSSAAEWLLDNDYHVQRAILQIRQDLPPNFYRKLPGISGEVHAQPRMHDIAHALLRATRLQITFSSAVQFLQAYQETMPLSIAEVWAFPTMLRLACLELLISGFSALFPDVEAPPTTPVATLDTSDTERVARGIANLAIISGIQWKDVFDETSKVEAILRRDPAGVYAKMDFDTRDKYRGAVEQLAERARLPEWDVAERVLHHCHSESDQPTGHVGFWLVDAGRARFEDAIDSRPLALETIARRVLRYPGTLYACGLVLAGLLSFLVPSLYLLYLQASPALWLCGLLFSAIPASMLSITLVNWIVTLVVKPRTLPKLDFERAIDPDIATAVVMPVLVATLADVAPLMQRLEAHRLANPDPSLQFVLLSDPADAGQERLPGDEAVEAALVAGIAKLNARYPGEGDGPFRLMHRHRDYNPAQGCWMAWERKRGKLEQFNSFILSGDMTPFHVVAGDVAALRRVRFVVTGDADTRFGPRVVNRLVAALAHPLNKAHFDAASGRVARGYTILQPRVEIAPDASGSSAFSRLYGGDATIDIYSRAVSDVYQDLLGTGIYVGKGIYEVEAFARSVEGRIPENALLSHDLFEGLHGRAALVSDIIAYEGFPASYTDYAWRWHRWVRGDWQIAAWLLPFVPDGEGRWVANRLSWFDRLKIFDNLRRSLVPASILALLLAGWFLLPGRPLVWTALALAAPAASLFTDLVTGLARGRRRGVVQGTFHRLGDGVGRWALAVAFLVSDTAVAIRAITVTLWRLWSDRHLLEWTSSAHMSARLAAQHRRRAAWRLMWPSPLFSVVAAAGLADFAPHALAAAAPLLLLWFLAPEIACWISRPTHALREALTEQDEKFLRRIARRTWLFFETFVTPEDNWLPPDNHQEAPDEQTAHRTSPTNIGMMLLSVLTACRLGYIGLNEVELRLRNTLTTLAGLQQYRGHIFNWYDTRTLEALEPRYVSTVDSGNLAVSLVTIGQALGEMVREGPLSRRLWDGLEDLFDLLVEGLRAMDLVNVPAVADRLQAMRADVCRRADDETAWTHAIDRLLTLHLPALREAIHQAISGRSDIDEGSLREVLVWIERTDHHLAAMKRDLGIFAPWDHLLAGPPVECAELTAELLAVLQDGRPRFDLDARLDRAEGRLRDCAKLAEGHKLDWMHAVLSAIASGRTALMALDERLQRVTDQAIAAAHAMDFAILFDHGNRLFHIGYNVSTDRIDPHHYDLLASEARLASFFAIAKGDVAPEHWFHLGRPITRQAAGLALVSWNGSMFEYLMPNIFLRSDPMTLLGQSDRSAVDVQRAFARTNHVPWGISESAFASVGHDGSYRYHAFGVPDLGLRRGLGRDLVIAPYATSLALAVRPGQALRNLRELAGLDLVGRYGFFEAADFTADRQSEGGRFVPVRTYMAHHQGMSLAAMGNALCDDMFVRWFHADPHVRTIDLLLNERIPWELPPEISRMEIREAPKLPDSAIPALHGWTPVATEMGPSYHAIGNGRLSTLFRSDGGGGLMRNGVALTRLAPDDHDAGYWLYLRDLDDGQLWSITQAPVPGGGEGRLTYSAHQIEYHRQLGDIAATLIVSLAQGDDVEIRRLTLVNNSDRVRTLDVTSYAEVVLAPPLEAARHPAFSKLFVSSEPLPNLDGLLFARRPRGAADVAPVLLHRLVTEPRGAACAIETDRRAFLGRHGSNGRPEALSHDALSGTAGWTLDPVLALQSSFSIPPGGRHELAFVTIAAGSRESAIEVAERYATFAALDWATHDAATATARAVHAIGLRPEQLPLAQRLFSQLYLPAMPPGELSLASPGSRADLWSLGISGDDPLIMLRTGEGEPTDLLRFLLAAQALWRRMGIRVDLALCYEGEPGYVEPIREALLDVLQEAGAREQLGLRGGVHLINIGRGEASKGAFLERAARLVLHAGGPELEDQLRALAEWHSISPRFTPMESHAAVEPVAALERPALLFDNGLGGFAPDDGAYVIHLDPGRRTPAPWANVLANPGFGTIVTEAGLGFSWAANSGENRLTPWFNDPVRDAAPEQLFLRDEETAAVWSMTPWGADHDAPCRIEHGAGYSAWRRNSHGLEQHLQVFVPLDEPVKLVRLQLRNSTDRPRRITATYYAEWLLGAVAGEPAPLRTAVYDPASHALLARNPWSDEFKDAVAFLTSSMAPHSITTSRRDFLGLGADRALPEGLLNWDLGNRRQASGADCCGAYQIHLDLAPGASVEAVFALGEGETHARALELIGRWQDPAETQRAWTECQAVWKDRLGKLVVKTPDPAFDLMVNRWLPCQTLNARVRARAGYYQAGGAFGFRDQLQDILALIFSDPGTARAHIVAAAAHQFEEGDVLHWWHPPAGRGVRTRCSDDLLWLPYVVAAYVRATGDAAILEEAVPFLSGPPLAQEEADRYAQFATAPARSLFEHCERALDHGHRLGAHGLPLMGSGDWNDGMDRVGHRGKGESVWLAWFLIDAIAGFVTLSGWMNRPDLQEKWSARAVALAAAADRAGWDGDWYLRAYDDDGRPWGSAAESECRIDSIAQSWAVLSGAAPAERAARAVASALHHLVREDDDIVRLLDPPFDRTPREPGYIKAYPPGVRENGGQYTHAAAWLAMATARLGDGDGAKALFDRINPIHHALTFDAAEAFRVEPYVLAGDVASNEAFLGRGGWTWYTGAAAWTWKLAVEEMLGLRLVDGAVQVAPCLPKRWDRVEATLRRDAGTIALTLSNPHGLSTGRVVFTVDGALSTAGAIEFPAAGETRHVEATLLPDLSPAFQPS